ncbi:hypothetical protein [Pseudophaeobacter sp.]|jgi:hypothetical protein|uniref:hypothetical protein n=1 Tax=Pseudophaeobacter TaxID=1541822 RepID=UPI003A97E790
MRQMLIPFAVLPVFLAELAVLPLPSQAAEPMSAAEFDRYTQGKTLFYGLDGSPYGAERYLPNHRVIWSFLDGRCQEGIWYQEADQICFVYQNLGPPQCWSFTLTPDGLNARFQNDPQATHLYEANEVDQEMICLGPEVGV